MTLPPVVATLSLSPIVTALTACSETLGQRFTGTILIFGTSSSAFPFSDEPFPSLVYHRFCSSTIRHKVFFPIGSIYIGAAYSQHSSAHILLVKLELPSSRVN